MEALSVVCFFAPTPIATPLRVSFVLFYPVHLLRFVLCRAPATRLFGGDWRGLVMNNCQKSNKTRKIEMIPSNNSI